MSNKFGIKEDTGYVISFNRETGQTIWQEIPSPYELLKRNLKKTGLPFEVPAPDGSNGSTYFG